ncbi:MAG: sugar ABC transporter permease [Elusimicrobiota bacterium]|jgi:raffinose/stachyose/melibiose transport system permease protein|nr:sugar ABC transporter permease [Elusimicrobiota bacterium]
MQRFLKRYYLLFTALVFAAFLISFVIPFCMSVYLSLVHFNSFTDFQWAGIDNFIEIFALNSPFMGALLLTLKFAVICAISVNIISFVIAFIFKSGFKGSKFFKSAFFMPSILSGIVLGYVWQIIFSSILNNLFALNLSGVSEYSSFQLSLIMNWQLIGYMILIYTASFNAVSQEVLEAARTDGASPFRILISIKIPSFMPSVIICIFLSAFNAFKIFEQNLILSQSAADFPQMLALNIFNTFYKKQELIGQAGAQTVIFFVIAAILSFIIIRAVDKRGIADE